MAIRTGTKQMHDEQEFVSTKLRLDRLTCGQIILLQQVDEPESPRQQAQLIGWLAAESLIVKPPDGINWPLVLPQYTDYVVRLFDGNHAYAFETSILSIHHDPFSYFHLVYPKEVKTSKVRQAPRVAVDLEIGLTTADKKVTAVRTSDFSQTGIGFLGPPNTADVGDSLQLEFDIRVTETSYSFSEAVIVRNVRRSGKDSSEMVYGVEFATLDRTKGMILSAFLFEQRT